MHEFCADDIDVNVAYWHEANIALYCVPSRYLTLSGHCKILISSKNRTLLRPNKLLYFPQICKVN